MEQANQSTEGVTVEQDVEVEWRIPQIGDRYLAMKDNGSTIVIFDDGAPVVLTFFGEFGTSDRDPQPYRWVIVE